MTEEKYREIKGIKDNIELLENKLKDINKMFNTCGIKCEITGMRHGTDSHIKCTIINKEGILNLLTIEKQKIEKTLIEANQVFKDL